MLCNHVGDKVRFTVFPFSLPYYFLPPYPYPYHLLLLSYQVSGFVEKGLLALSSSSGPSHCPSYVCTINDASAQQLARSLKLTLQDYKSVWKEFYFDVMLCCGMYCLFWDNNENWSLFNSRHYQIKALWHMPYTRPPVLNMSHSSHWLTGLYWSLL